MKFGIMFANTGAFATPEGASALATAADEMGLESIWAVEHVVIPHGYQSQYPYNETGKIPGGEDPDIPDPLIWLSYVAGQTKRIRLATGILIVPQRNPLVLAKECATLDKLSGGRFELGIGVGWLAEEFDALGVPFADRGRRTDEYVRRHAGAVEPAPGRLPRSLRLLLGRHLPAPARRRARCRSSWAGTARRPPAGPGATATGFFPIKGSLDELSHLLDVMKAEARAHGRDGDDIGSPTAPGAPSGTRSTR